MKRNIAAMDEKGSTLEFKDPPLEPALRLKAILDEVLRMKNDSKRIIVDILVQQLLGKGEVENDDEKKNQSTNLPKKS